MFAMACMALNILVGYTGPHLVRPRRLVRPGRLCGRDAAARTVSRLDPAADRRRRWPWSRSLALDVRLPDPAPARRLLLAADAGAGRHALRGRLPLDRRSPAARTASAASRGPMLAGSRFENNAALLRAGRGDRLRRRLRTVALPPLARRARAGRDPRERAARAASSAIRPTATSCSPSCSRRPSPGSPAACCCSTTA